MDRGMQNKLVSPSVGKAFWERTQNLGQKQAW